MSYYVCNLEFYNNLNVKIMRKFNNLLIIKLHIVLLNTKCIKKYDYTNY